MGKRRRSDEGVQGATNSKCRKNLISNYEILMKYISRQNTISGEARSLIEWMPGDEALDRVGVK